MIKLLWYVGPFAWPLVILAAVIVVLTIKNTLGLFSSKEDERRMDESRPNAILFWGCISLLMGFLAHYMGMYNATQAIARAGAVETGVLAGGYGEALLPILMGMFIFLFSALAWFVLRWRYRKLGGGS